MLEVGKEVAVLSDYEQRVWDDVQRFWAEDAVEPDLPRHRPTDDLAELPAWVVGGAWFGILLIVLGGPLGGFAVGLAAALGWGLWRLRHRRRGQAAPRSSSGSAARSSWSDFPAA